MLRITKQTDYGILLLTHFVGEGAVDAAFSARDLARKTLLPLPMVSKILKPFRVAASWSRSAACGAGMRSPGSRRRSRSHR